MPDANLLFKLPIPTGSKYVDLLNKSLHALEKNQQNAMDFLAAVDMVDPGSEAEVQGLQNMWKDLRDDIDNHLDASKVTINKATSYLRA